VGEAVLELAERIGIIRMVSMTFVDVFSIGIGSAIILGLLGSIAIEGLRRGKNGRKVITTIDTSGIKFVHS
jgi:hypothetical protein